MIKIMKNLKVSQYTQKRYADNKINHKDFKVEDHVYLKVKSNKRSLRMGTYAKLEPHFCGLFEVFEIVGPVAYRISLPPTVRSHNVFHVSLLKKYVHDSNHVVDWTMM